jgi:hypothetical protein
LEAHLYPFLFQQGLLSLEVHLYLLPFQVHLYLYQLLLVVHHDLQGLPFLLDLLYQHLVVHSKPALMIYYLKSHLCKFHLWLRYHFEYLCAFV